MNGRAVWCALAALLVAVSTGAAQNDDIVIRGRVIGPDGGAVPQQSVVLHKVQGAAGTTVAESLTDDAGRFELRAPALGDTANVYFIAARYEGELYIGAPFREMQEGARSQVLQVGVPGTSATALLGSGSTAPLSTGRPLTSRSWLLLAIPLLGVAAVGVYALLQRDRLPADRATFIRIAELDERAVDAPSGQRDALRAERERLLADLRRT